MTEKEFHNIIESEQGHDIFVAFGVIGQVIRHPKFLNLNGYIYLSPTHPWYKKHYNEIDAEVHGGLTYSELDKETGYWCIGFDTNHAGDLSLINFMMGGNSDLYDTSYKNWDYVKNEVESLAYQASLIGIADLNLDNIIAKKFLLQRSKDGYR